MSALPGLAPVGPAGRVAAALGDQREGHLLERFDLAHDAVAAAVEPRAARAAAQGIGADAQREFALERLDGRVERVAHRDVNAAGPIGVGAGALAAAERLVVGEARVAEREVVHRALAEGAAERAEHQVGHPGGGLDVAGRHRRARAGIEHGAQRGAHLDRAVGAGRGRDVGVGEDAHGEQARRAGDGERAVEIAGVLGGAAGEVEGQPIAGQNRAQAQLEVALAAPRARPWRERPDPERGQAGAGAALGVVEHRVGGLAQPVRAEAQRELAQALGAGAVGGELGAQVGSALGRLAHAAPPARRSSTPAAGAARSPRPPPAGFGCRRASTQARARPRRHGARGSRRSPAAPRPGRPA